MKKMSGLGLVALGMGAVIITRAFSLSTTSTYSIQWWAFEAARTTMWLAVGLALAMRLGRIERRVTALEEEVHSRQEILDDVSAIVAFEKLRIGELRDFEHEVLSDIDRLAPGDGDATLTV